jgi:hypothetical protein
MRITLFAIMIFLLACARDLPEEEKPGYWDVKPVEIRLTPDAATQPEVTAPLPDVSPANGISAPIAIDGLFDDWEAVPALVDDPTGDGGSSGIDFASFKVANDGIYLYLYMETGAEIELDWGHGLTLFIDCDGNPDTGSPMHGFGAEIRWVMGQRYGEAWGPNGVLDIGWTQLGFVSAPTVTSNRFEMAILQASLYPLAPACDGNEITLWLADDSGAGGDLAPEGTALARYQYSELPVAPPPQALLEKADGVVRIMSYNVLWSSILDPAKEAHFRRIFQALQPDIINLQEILEHEETEKIIRQWLGGDFHSLGFSDRVTISRLPIIWDWPTSYEPLAGKYTVVPVETGPDQMLVLFNAHLSFGWNDVDRQLEADSFVAFIRDAKSSDGGTYLPPSTPFAVLGDLNLVGDAQQLKTLTIGDIVNSDIYGPSHPPDWDKTGLTDLHLLQSGARMTYTWQVDDGGFWPGKLDFFIYSDSVLTVVNQFILNTGTMSAEQLAWWELEAGDTGAASDHLPIVIDVVLPVAN